MTQKSSVLATVLAENAVAENAWLERFREALAGVSDMRVVGHTTASQPGQVVFVDGQAPDLSEVLSELDRRGRAVILLVSEGDAVPAALSDGRVDDVLVHPFRKLEVLGKLKHYQQILMWDEVAKLNASFSGLIAELRNDLQLAERLQKSRLPVRFPEVKGFKVTSRYLAGFRSGGDFLDLAESRDGSQLAIVLSDSSSYGLSSAVLSALMRVTAKLSVEQVGSVQETVRRVYEELLLPLGEQDRLSLFYGMVSRKDYSLRYLNLGDSRAFRAAKGGEFEMLPSQGGAMSQASRFSVGRAQISEVKVHLVPDDRLVVLSDGFIEIAGGEDHALSLLNQFRAREAADLINEFTFHAKKGLNPENDLPPQDCTAMVFDVDSRLIRLAT